VKAGDFPSAQTPRSAFSRLAAPFARQPNAAGECREWRSLDEVTLTRLTWLWLGYGAFALVAGQRQLPPVCLFGLVTGHRCPLCGLTRSVNRLMRGHMRASFGQHPVGPILYVGSGLLLASAWLHAGGRRWRKSGYAVDAQSEKVENCPPSAHGLGFDQSDMNGSWALYFDQNGKAIR
jgi:hypothetical protein